MSTYGGQGQENPRHFTSQAGRNDPLVSVIIPAYQCAQYIGQAIDSVLGQSFSDYEIIVVNDGSPDTEGFERALESVGVDRPDVHVDLSRELRRERLPVFAQVERVFLAFPIED